jgi:hypothetical protein
VPQGWGASSTATTASSAASAGSLSSGGSPCGRLPPLSSTSPSAAELHVPVVAEVFCSSVPSPGAHKGWDGGPTSTLRVAFLLYLPRNGAHGAETRGSAPCLVPRCDRKRQRRTPGCYVMGVAYPCADTLILRGEARCQ